MIALTSEDCLTRRGVGDRDPGYRSRVTSVRTKATVALLALAILAGNVAWVSATTGFLHKPHQVPEHDHLRYLEMARGAAGDAQLARQSPYCFRVLVPAVARVLARRGMKLNLAFWLLTNLALFGFLLALERYLALVGFELHERLLGLALVGLVQGCVRWFEYQYWMTDPEGLFLVVLALVLLHRERQRALGVVNVVAALVRETHVIIYPYIFFHRLQRYGWRDALRTTFVVVLPALAVLVLLRLWIVPVSGPTLMEAVTDNLDFRFRHLFDNQLYLLSLGTWGVLLPLALLSPVRALDLARRHPGPLALLVTVYATTFLISNNNERPLAYAVPVILPAALDGVRRLVRLGGVRFAHVAVVVLGLQLIAYQQTLFTGLGISIYQPTNLLVILVLTTAYVGARLWLRGRVPTVLPAPQ